MVVVLEVGPIQNDKELGPLSQDKRNPDRREKDGIEGRVAQKTIDLFGGMFGSQSLGHGQAGADGMDGQGSALQESRGGIGNGGDALGMEHGVKEVGGKLGDTLGAEVNFGRHDLQMATVADRSKQAQERD